MLFTLKLKRNLNGCRDVGIGIAYLKDHFYINYWHKTRDAKVSDDCSVSRLSMCSNQYISDNVGKN